VVVCSGNQVRGECRTADQHGAAFLDAAVLVGELGAPRLRDHTTMTIANGTQTDNHIVNNLGSVLA
jgi:hypothetical protein